ncbi:MAG: glycosyltransferase family 4 protein [Actinomycetota bacterium]
MRVALNLEQLFQRPPGGIGRYAAALARVLPTVGEPEDDEVVVLPFVAKHDRSEVAAVLSAAGIVHPAVTIPYRRPLLYELWNRWNAVDPLAQPGTATHRRVHGAQVVHAPSVAVPPRNRVPLVVTVHDAAPILFPTTFPRRGRRFHTLGFVAAADRADAVVAPSVAAADEIAACTAIARERIHPIHHGVDQTRASDDEVARAREELGLADHPYVCWVGTLEPRKDVGVLVDAFARVVASDDVPHRLVLVGPGGWLDGADDAARHAASLGDRVRFTGPVASERLRALYRGADVFALPSRHEGFGLPVLEAAVQGTAVLASDLPVLREVAADTARFAPVGDPDAWADALGALLRDDVGRAALGAAGAARAREFTWERSARTHLAVYRSLL